MKHTISPYEDQKNVPTCKGESAPTAIEIRFPETFGARAWHMIEELGDTVFLYLYNNRFIVTDELCELESPRWSGESLEALENWLEEQASLKDAEEPGWEEPYKVAPEYPVKGENRQVFATTFVDALRTAMARGYVRIEFPVSGLRYDIPDYIRENADDTDKDEADYAIFEDVIVRLGDAWGKDADVTRLLD